MPSIRGAGGERSRSPWGLQQQRSCQTGSWLQSRGAHVRPCPCFPQPALGKAAVEGEVLTPPCVLGSLLSPPAVGRCGCSPRPWAARGGSDARHMSRAPSFSCFCAKILAVLQRARLSALLPPLPCPPAWPVPSPPLPWPPVFIPTSILSAPGALVSWGGLRGRGVPAALPRVRLLSFPGAAIFELLPRRALRPLSCCPLRGALGHAEAVPECVALGVASPGMTGSSFLPCPCPCPSRDFNPAQSRGQSPHGVPISESQRAQFPPTPGATILLRGEHESPPGSVPQALRFFEHTQGRSMCRQPVGQHRGEELELLFCMFLSI